MPPRKARDQREFQGGIDLDPGRSSHIATRQSAAIHGLSQEIIAKRTKRHLDELEVPIGFFASRFQS